MRTDSTSLPSKPSRESPIALESNGRSIDDSNVIASQFNDYFCTIGSNLAESVKCVTGGKQPKDLY